MSQAQLETNDQYHADTTRLSNSMLSVLKKSPQEFHGRYIAKTMPHPQPTESMSLGSCVHCLTIEPLEVMNRFVIKPNGIDRRTKEGKAQWAELQALAVGKEIIDVVMYPQNLHYFIEDAFDTYMLF